MSTSDVAIANRALHMMGASTIIALDDTNERGRVLKAAYDAVRRAEIRRYNWRFAIKRVSIPALADPPDSDYGYQFELPVDCLRVLRGGDVTTSPDLSDYRVAPLPDFSVEGRKLLCNQAGPLSLRYLADVTDANTFDAAFCESFAARLALECVERITESSQKEQGLMLRYRESIKEARRANAIEAVTQYADDAEWVLARAG